MTGPMRPLDHPEVDELAGAFALGALDADELRAVTEHLETCPEPHTELRSLLGAGDVLASSLEPVTPSGALRERLMETVARTTQDHAAPAPARVTERARATERVRGRGLLDWLSPTLARGLAVAAVVVALGFGAWNISLQNQVTAREHVLQQVAQAIASGQSAFRVSGSGGSGYVVADKAGNAKLVVADLAPIEANRIYELWLIGSDNKPVAVGTFGPPANAVAVVSLERGIQGFGVFAVTVESKRVDAPTLPIVMSAKLQS
jgi:anti-sigma-K factor RskA